MIQKVLLPQLGETMVSAKVERWLARPGDKVTRGQVILQITTDKATLDVESLVSGTLLEILAKEGEEAPVNDTLALVGEKGESIPEDARKRLPLIKAAKPAAPAGTPAAAAAPLGGHRAASAAPGAALAGRPSPPPVFLPGARRPPAGPLVQFHEPLVPLVGGVANSPPASPRAKALAGREHVSYTFLAGSGEGGRVTERDVAAYLAEVERIRVTPTAKRVAEEKGVDLRTVRPADPSGRVSAEDVEAAAAAGVGGGAFEKKPLTEMRRIIAERMTYSQQTAPQFYVTQVADMTAATEIKKKLKDDGHKVGYNDMIVRAAALAIREHREYAAFFDSDGFVYRSEVNIGVAVSLDSGGLIVPVVRRADELGLVALAERSKELVDKARTNRLTPDEYQGSVFTVSNLGMFGVEHFSAIVQPGESGILAVGKVDRRPVVVGKAIEIRPTVNFTLTSDHRVADGVAAAKFCDTLRRLLEAPEGLL